MVGHISNILPNYDFSGKQESVKGNGKEINAQNADLVITRCLIEEKMLNIPCF
jgi:hypothetical protein